MNSNEKGPTPETVGGCNNLESAKMKEQPSGYVSQRSKINKDKVKLVNEKRESEIITQKPKEKPKKTEKIKKKKTVLRIVLRSYFNRKDTKVTTWATKHKLIDRKIRLMQKITLVETLPAKRKYPTEFENQPIESHKKFKLNLMKF